MTHEVPGALSCLYRSGTSGVGERKAPACPLILQETRKNDPGPNVEVFLNGYNLPFDDFITKTWFHIKDR